MIYIIIAGGIAAIDQFFKYLIISNLSLFQTIDILPFFHIIYVQNTGAAFSLFQNATLFLGILTLFLLLVMAVLWKKPYIVPYHLPLALLTGGALGNMIDRLFRGYVIDYIQVFSWFPVFNLADIMVVTGVGIAAIFILKNDNTGKGREAEDGNGKV